MGSNSSDPPQNPTGRPQQSSNGSVERAVWGKRTCDVCGLTFARGDTLKRHKLKHDEDRMPPRSRAKACMQCAKSKLKCDSQKPKCSRCEEKQVSCIYPNNRSQSPPTRSQSIDDPTPTTSSFIRNQKEVSFALNTSVLPLSPSIDSLDVNSVNTFSSDIPQLPTPQQTNTQPNYLNSQPQTDTIFPGAGFSGSSLPFPFDPFNFLEGGIGGMNHYETTDVSPDVLDPNTALSLDTSDTFWSEWDYLTSTLNLPDLANQLSDPITLSNQPIPATFQSDPMNNRRTSQDDTTISRAPSPAFFESDRITSAMRSWHTYWDASRDDGDLFRGQHQVVLRTNTHFDITVTDLKAQWPALTNFTYDNRSTDRILDAVLFSGLPQKEQQAVFRSLIRLEKHIYIHFFALYLQHVHYRLPFLHLPTLNPAIDHGLLTLAIISIGSFYSDIQTARQFGIVMLEIVRRGCEFIMNRQPKCSRDIQLVQALLLTTIARAAGGGREAETYERYRLVQITVIRRMMGFQPLTPPQPPLSADGSEVSAWRAWRKHEQLKRTALACFVLEVDAAVLSQLGVSVNLSELEVSLPCSEALWNAKNAQEWINIYQTPTPVGCMPIRNIVNQIGRTIYPATEIALQDPFSALVVCKSLMVSAQALMELEYCAPLAFSATLIELNAVQDRMAIGNNPMIPWFASEPLEMQPRAIIPALLAFHTSALLRYVRPYQMSAIAGRGAREWDEKAREQLSMWMLSHALEARKLALHAGQIIRITRDMPCQSPEEGLAAFFSIVYLYMIIKVAPFTPLGGNSIPAMTLDNPQIENPSLWLNLGFPPRIREVGSLTEPGAAVQLLMLFGRILSTRIWVHHRFLGEMLLNLAEKEKVLLG